MFRLWYVVYVCKSLKMQIQRDLKHSSRDFQTNLNLEEGPFRTKNVCFLLYTLCIFYEHVLNKTKYLN